MPKYMDINLRLGYHFTIIDAYISEAVNDNYIYFRFLGGATDFVRRSRRAECIARILANYDFRVEVHGDIVVGRLKKLALPRMAERMRMIGGLICYTRQLDAQMDNDADIALHTERFAELMNNMLRGKDDSHRLS
jgi:pyruvate,water dikinase